MLQILIEKGIDFVNVCIILTHVYSSSKECSLYQICWLEVNHWLSIFFKIMEFFLSDKKKSKSRHASATTSHGVQEKEAQKDTGNLFGKNLQLKGVCWF